MTPLRVETYIVGMVQTNCYFAINDDTKEVLIIDPGASAAKLMEKINNEINKKYPTLSRGIYKKQGPGVNGVYNQDFSSNCILIEFGGQYNTIDEVYNTVEVLSKILANYMGEDNES